MISAHSGPTMCTPTTLSLSAATISFIIAFAGFPEIVFFIGLHDSRRERQWEGAPGIATDMPGQGAQPKVKC